MDEHRIELEQAIARYFSSWLTIIVSNRELAIAAIGEEDFSNFQSAINELYYNVPADLISRFDPDALSIAPGFILAEVSPGGHKTRKKIALQLMAAAVTGIVGSATMIVGGRLTKYFDDTQKSIAIESALICTNRTAKGFVTTLNQHVKHAAELPERAISSRLDRERDELTKLIASMPHNECRVSIIAKNQEGKTVAEFKQDKTEAVDNFKRHARKHFGRRI